MSNVLDWLKYYLDTMERHDEDLISGEKSSRMWFWWIEVCQLMRIVSIWCRHGCREPAEMPVYGFKLLIQITSDAASDLAEATVPCLNVEAAADLWNNLRESSHQTIEIVCSDTTDSAVEGGKVLNLFVQDGGVVEQVNDVINTTSNTDQMGTEFTTVWIINLESLEQILGLWIDGEKLVEDGSSNSYLAVSER